MDIIDVDDKGDTELMRLCKARLYKDMLQSFPRITQLVIDKDEAYINYQNKENKSTALKYAVQHYFYNSEDISNLPLRDGILRILIASGKVHPSNQQIVDLTYRDNMLMYAARHRCVEAVVLCLSEGCNPKSNLTGFRKWDDLYHANMARDAFEALEIGPSDSRPDRKVHTEMSVIRALLNNYKTINRQ